ncbi:MAG: uracil-xanthine permease [Clostridiales bacterium]|jgi:uracil permease|nr:uracil-xanthine permease [Clostridiales bacterium]
MDKPQNNLIYQIKDKPPFHRVVLFSLQQLLAIIAATIVVPLIIGNGMSQAAALLGAGIGTIVYLLFTKSRSPVFLGSSFAFIGSMLSAFAGASTAALGYAGLLIGAVIAGLVYVIIAIVVKFVGVNWINKLMPAVIIGPTVAIIGLSLAGNAVGDLMGGAAAVGGTYEVSGQTAIYIICGLVTLITVMISSVYSKKIGRLIPFIIGILAGYFTACIFYIIGSVGGWSTLKIIDFTPITGLFKEISLKSFINYELYKEFTVYKAWGAFDEVNGTYLLTLFTAYAPVAFVVFAEHLADHKNLSSIVGKDLLKDPGLTRTLLGDGIGSIAGATVGGCPNTTYGESIGCVAITKNASTVSIWGAAIAAIAFSMIAPVISFIQTIPKCVMGGVCFALYGFIAVSGLKMLQKVNLSKNRNLFVASVILIAGVGGLQLQFGKVTVRTVACALILGIVSNVILSLRKNNDDDMADEYILTENKEKAE